LERKQNALPFCNLHGCSIASIFLPNTQALIFDELFITIYNLVPHSLQQKPPPKIHVFDDKRFTTANFNEQHNEAKVTSIQRTENFQIPRNFEQ
jgi:hypothetical protein